MSKAWSGQGQKGSHGSGERVWARIIPNPKLKLLDQCREVLRVKHYSLRTEEAYVQWARRFLKFHRDQAGVWKHPRELGAMEVVAFLNHLANAEHVAAATQNQALNALLGDGRWEIGEPPHVVFPAKN